MIGVNHSNHAESDLQLFQQVWWIWELIQSANYRQSIENILSSVHVLMRTMETGRFVRYFLVRGL
jgi:hypothetical protein